MASESDLMSAIGKCGKFQVFLTIAVNLSTVACVWGTMFMSFGNFNPGWACADDEIDDVANMANDTSMYFRQTTLPSSDNQRNGTEWSLDCAVKTTCLNLIYNAESSTVATEWDLSCDSSWILSIIVSIEMSGALLGCYFSGQIGDKFGRKVSLYGHLALHCITHVLMAFSISWQMYTAVSFFNGFSIGGVITNSYPYPMEFVNSWWRGVIVSIPEWNISFVVFVLAVYLIRDWKYVHILTALMSALVFLAVFWTPESVRWLTVKGRVNQAKRVMGRIAHMNGKSIPDTRIIDRIANEEKARMGNHTYTYLDLLRIPTLRSYTLKFSFVIATMAWIYYGVTFGMRTLSGDFYLNLLISALLEFPAMFFVAPAVNILGRRRAILVYFFLEVACCIAVVVMSLTASGHVRDTSVLVFALFCKMIIVGCWGICNVYTSEVFPTVVRSLQFGFMAAVSRLASIVSPFIIPNDPDKLYVSFIILTVLALISCAFLWTLPETKGRELKDTIKELTHPNVLEANPMQNDME